MTEALRTDPKVCRVALPPTLLLRVEALRRRPLVVRTRHLAQGPRVLGVLAYRSSSPVVVTALGDNAIVTSRLRQEPAGGLEPLTP